MRLCCKARLFDLEPLLSADKQQGNHIRLPIRLVSSSIARAFSNTAKSAGERSGRVGQREGSRVQPEVVRASGIVGGTDQ